MTGLYLALLMMGLPGAVADPPPAPEIHSVTPDRGHPNGGTNLTIHGQHLSSPEQVTFGGVAAQAFGPINNQELWAVTPAHAEGTVDLVVTGNKGTATSTFTYNASEPDPTAEPQPTESPPPQDNGTGSDNSTTPPDNTTSEDNSTQSSGNTTTGDNSTQSSNNGTTSDNSTSSSDDSSQTTGGDGSEGNDAGSGGPGPTSTTTTTTVTSTEPVEDAGGVLEVEEAVILQSYATEEECWVALAPSAPGERLVVPFDDECGVAAVVVNVPAGASLLNLTVARLSAVPIEVGSPLMHAGPAMVFEAILRDQDGNEIEPGDTIVQLRIPDVWLQDCPPETCLTTLFHYVGQQWTVHELRQVDQAEGTVVLQARVDSFSLFAVGGLPNVAPGGASNAWIWIVFVVVGLAVATPVAWSQRDQLVALVTGKPQEEADDAKVHLLLEEMRNKEELLRFMNTAAHDLANPLTPIQLQLDLLSDAAKDSEDASQQEALGLVQQNFEQLAMLVQDMRDASKLQAGRLKFFPEDHDLSRIVREAAESFQPQARKEKITLKVSASAEAPVEVDRGRIGQLMANLIGNALKFTPQGGRVDVSVSHDEGDALVYVRDSGAGMTRDDQAKLFQPFSQGHGDREKAQGTGLGLYIAKGIVEGHNGRIGCTSDGPGLGSMFWFTVPLRPKEADPAPDEPTADDFTGADPTPTSIRTATTPGEPVDSESVEDNENGKGVAGGPAGRSTNGTSKSKKKATSRKKSANAKAPAKRKSSKAGAKKKVTRAVQAGRATPNGSSNGKGATGEPPERPKSRRGRPGARR